MIKTVSGRISVAALLRFTAPTVFMMMFMSLYTMADGIFVSRLIGTAALSAVNIVYPLVSLVIALGVMLATGGSAVAATLLGEGRAVESRQSFTLITIAGVLTGLIFSLTGFVLLAPLLRLLGTTENMYAYCRDYLLFLLPFVPLAILQMLFQCFFVTAGKPNIGLCITIGGGLANIVLDYLFIGVFGMGMAGAAIATGIGFSIPASFGLLYFTFKRSGSLYFVRPRLNWRILAQTCGNGLSEMVTNLSMAVTTFLFNVMMMKYLGENGVAAVTIVLYAEYLLTAAFLGYSTGIAPLFSYNHGNKGHTELKKLFKISVVFIVIVSFAVSAGAYVLAPLLVSVFSGRGTEVYSIALGGFRLFAGAYLFMGINIFASAMFTAFSDGKVSAVISFARTFMFIVAAILTLPLAFGVTGIWLAVPIAELLSFAVSAGYFYRLRAVYKYW